MTVYIPYGLLCIGITIIIIIGLQKARDNKKTNRQIRNNERFQNIITAVKEKEKDNSKETELNTK